MRSTYQMQIDVEIEDYALLRTYALARALAAGLSEHEFTEGECETPDDNAEYWIGWVFDAGTPKGCGLSIINSAVVYTGGSPWR